MCVLASSCVGANALRLALALAPVWEHGQLAAHVSSELGWHRGSSGWEEGLNWVGGQNCVGVGVLVYGPASGRVGLGTQPLGHILGLNLRLYGPDSSVRGF